VDEVDYIIVDYIYIIIIIPVTSVPYGVRIK
jgi:hypothetical protein